MGARFSAYSVDVVLLASEHHVVGGHVDDGDDEVLVMVADPSALTVRRSAARPGARERLGPRRDDGGGAGGAPRPLSADRLSPQSPGDEGLQETFCCCPS